VEERILACAAAGLGHAILTGLEADVMLTVEANAEVIVMRSSHDWLNSGDKDDMSKKHKTRDRDGGTREPWFLRVEDVADLFGVSRSTIYNWINSEQLPTVRIAGCRRIPMDQLRVWIAQQSQ
jgi:excisionase family DNA binding protein